MSNPSEVLQKLSKQNGFIATAIGHGESGMVLEAVGDKSRFDIDVAIATNCEVVKAKLKAMKALQLDSSIEDILITLGNQYHLIRPYRKNPIIFFYLAIEREGSNLAMARMALEQAEANVEF